ncbi:TWiK family of potassium channels protein 12 [Topomyia yanbarensis]|uniref:TWiK family of potassium channels protein 12 n=1 Tax=Topomyia yanbarensis TaxID=2498891 RepID=UPI00273B66C5|nr:TWiK family of potassium channels protein 12 [Topomyia yanbarensis]
MKMNRQRSSVRSRGSSSTTTSDPREKVKDCCRKFIAFMCTQVGVGGLIVVYALVGAASFMSIETQEPNHLMEHVANLRRNCAAELWEVTEQHNLFNSSVWHLDADLVLKRYQDEFAEAIKRGYDGRTPEEAWNFPAALMFCLAVFTMIGYGNMVPRTPWGKGATVIYATFGIPLYILYFMNMGKVLASTFKWLYTWLHECSHDNEDDLALEDGSGVPQRKRIIVPTTACLWVISIYIATGTIMFAEWEKWSYLDSAYFCVTSLCKIGIGDLVPGANILDSQSGKPTKLVINFVYMLLGMGLVAMCYILMREEVRIKMQEIKEDTRLCLEDMSSKFAKCFGSSKDAQYYD